MSYPFSIPENVYSILALAPQHGTAAAQPALAVSLKNVHKLWAVVTCNTSGASAVVAIVPQTDALVAFGTPAVLTTAVPIWVVTDNATSPALVRATSAVNYTTVADAFHKQVIFEIDPAELAAGEDCFRISLTAAAADWVEVHYLIAPRYPGGAPFAPSYIVD